MFLLSKVLEEEWVVFLYFIFFDSIVVLYYKMEGNDSLLRGK